MDRYPPSLYSSSSPSVSPAQRRGHYGGRVRIQDRHDSRDSRSRARGANQLHVRQRIDTTDRRAERWSLDQGERAERSERLKRDRAERTERADRTERISGADWERWRERRKSPPGREREQLRQMLWNRERELDGRRRHPGLRGSLSTARHPDWGGDSRSRSRPRVAEDGASHRSGVGDWLRDGGGGSSSSRSFPSATGKKGGAKGGKSKGWDRSREFPRAPPLPDPLPPLLAPPSKHADAVHGKDSGPASTGVKAEQAADTASPDAARVEPADTESLEATEAALATGPRLALCATAEPPPRWAAQVSDSPPEKPSANAAATTAASSADAEEADESEAEEPPDPSLQDRIARLAEQLKAQQAAKAAATAAIAAPSDTKLDMEPVTDVKAITDSKPVTETKLVTDTKPVSGDAGGKNALAIEDAKDAKEAKDISKVQEISEQDILNLAETSEQEIYLRVPFELELPCSAKLKDIRSSIKNLLAKAELQTTADVSGMILGAGGQCFQDPEAQPLRMLVPGSMISLIEEVPEAAEVSSVGVCLNAMHLQLALQAQSSWKATTGAQVPLVQTPLPPIAPLPSGSASKVDEATNLANIRAQVMREQRERFYKTRLCINFAQGQCVFGLKCTFAHGEYQLRKRLQGSATPGIAAVAPADAQVPAERMPETQDTGQALAVWNGGESGKVGKGGKWGASANGGKDNWDDTGSWSGGAWNNRSKWDATGKYWGARKDESWWNERPGWGSQGHWSQDLDDELHWKEHGRPRRSSREDGANGRSDPTVGLRRLGGRRRSLSGGDLRGHAHRHRNDSSSDADRSNGRGRRHVLSAHDGRGRREVGERVGLLHRSRLDRCRSPSDDSRDEIRHRRSVPRGGSSSVAKRPRL